MQIQIIRAKSGGTVQYRNVFHAGWCILRGYGLRGVYQGLGATWMRNTPAFGIYFGSCCLISLVLCEEYASEYHDSVSRMFTLYIPRLR